MPLMLSAKGPRNGAPQRVFLAVAAYQGLAAAFATALFESIYALGDVEAELHVFAENCHVDDARNRLVAEFLASDCTDLVFLDSDVHWRPEDLIRLLRFDRDIVAGIYPLKHSEEAYPVLCLPGPRQSGEDGAVEVAGVPTGFMRICRPVLEALDRGARHFKDKSGAVMPLLFERVLDEERRGGDIQFCYLARAAGFRVYVDPEMRLNHFGMHRWSGSLGSFWRRTSGLSLAYGVRRLRTSDDVAEIYDEMSEAWDNPGFAGRSSLCVAAVMLAREARGPILECGSGLTTLMMAAVTDQPIYALESDPYWRQHTEIRLAKAGNPGRVHLVDAPIEEKHGYAWYDVSAALPESFGLVVCDGPRRNPRSRQGLCRDRIGLFIEMAERLREAIVLVDDWDDPDVQAMCEQSGLRFIPLGEHVAVARQGD